MKIAFSKPAEKSYKKLPKKIQIKTDKQLKFLLINKRHPSLRVKKLKGHDDLLEARIDYHYRFVFQEEKDKILIMFMGPHDEGLGKK
jgi:mRNA interferase RelE/StbE